MVHFFGIFAPDFGQRRQADEAPGKTTFFGGQVDAAFGAVPLTRAEQDALYLSGKSTARDPIEDACARPSTALIRDIP